MDTLFSWDQEVETGAKVEAEPADMISITIIKIGGKRSWWWISKVCATSFLMILFSDELLIKSAEGSYHQNLYFAPPGQVSQTLIEPRRPPKPRARWQNVDWRITAIPIGSGASLMLHYPAGSEDMASSAVRFVLQNIRELERDTGYEPNQSFMYVLFGNQAQFQQTHLFAISEGTLGVTNIQNLDLALFYNGDHQNFQQVSLHELTHQFTIQQVSEVAQQQGTSWSPLQQMPLWFIEGLAEHHAWQGQLDDETRAYMRDVLRNPLPEYGYWLYPFFGQDIWSYVQLYKIGHAKVHFLAETYGDDLLRGILRESWRMVTAGNRDKEAEAPDGAAGSPVVEAGTSSAAPPVSELTFPALIATLTGESPELIQERFTDWTQKNFGCASASQGASETLIYKDFVLADGNNDRFTDRFVIDPSGSITLFRSIDPHTGTTYLEVTPLNYPESTPIKLTEDDRPGLNSLHPFDRRNFAAGRSILGYSGRFRGKDIVEFQKYAVRESHTGMPQIVLTGPKTRFDPRREGILEVSNPTFSPDEAEVAFVGLGRDGRQNIWVLDLETGKLTRITDDPYSVRELDWGERGIVYSADATEDASYKLFLLSVGYGPEARKRRIDTRTVGVQGDAQGGGNGKADGPPPPASEDMGGETGNRAPAPTERYPRPIPLTDKETGAGTGNHAGPRFITPERIIFSSTAENGISQFFLLKLNNQTEPNHSEPDWTIEQVTLHQTGLWEPQPAVGSDGSVVIYGKTIKRGRPILTAVSEKHLRRTGPEWTALLRPDAKPWLLPEEPVSQLSTQYNPWQFKSWRVDQLMLAATTGLFGFGQLSASDRMRDRLIFFQAAGYGSLDLIDANLLYLNRTNRLNWGGELYHIIVSRKDIQTESPFLFGEYFLERQFGARGLIAWPLSSFTQVSASIAAEGRYRDPPFALNNEDATRWENDFGGPFPAVVAGLGLGYNGLRYQFDTGPVSGNSLDLRTELGYPIGGGTEELEATVNFDFQQYFRLAARANIGFRFAGGSNLSNRFIRDFRVTSWDNLRGLYYNDPYTRGAHYLVSNLELKFPLNRIIALAFINDIEGVMGTDFGSVFNEYGSVWDNRTLALAAGFNARLGPIILRLHFGYPINIGGYYPNPDWITQFSIKYLYW